VIDEKNYEKLGAFYLDRGYDLVTRTLKEDKILYDSKDRFALAMRINNLLASPGFESWLEGESLNIGLILYTAQGKPRASIFTISHLSDSERTFFVSIRHPQGSIDGCRTSCRKGR
jgi:hypothetical protein